MTGTTRAAPAAARPRVPRRWGAVGFLAPGTLFLFAFMVVPVGLLVVYSFLQRGRFGGVEATFTLENYARLLNPLYFGIVLQSIGIAAVVTVLALAIGYPVAWVIANLPARWRTVALVAVILPFWTSFLIRTYAWILLLNNAGLVNQGLKWLGWIGEPIPMLYTTPAVSVGLLYMYLPLMILPLYASISGIDPSLREAAADLGSSPARVFRTVTLPLSLPGALTGAVFVFVPSMSNFVIPELIGGGKTVMIGNLVRDQFLSARDWPFGATLALVVTAFLVALILLQSWISRRVTAGRSQ